MKKKELKFTYHYIKPKTPEEKDGAERRLQAAFDLLFEATLASEGWKQRKTNEPK